jgi:hypothetical protein
LPHPRKLLLEGINSGLEVSLGLLLGTISFHLGDQPPRPHTSYFPQQLVIEIGRASEEFVQPGLEGLHGHGVFVIFHFFVCIGVSKYFFDKGGVVASLVAGEACHHSPRQESDPVGLLPDVFLKEEHEVGSPLRVVPEVSLGSGVVGGLILPDSCLELLQSFVLLSVLVLVLL